MYPLEIGHHKGNLNFKVKTLIRDKMITKENGSKARKGITLGVTRDQGKIGTWRWRCESDIKVIDCQIFE